MITKTTLAVAAFDLESGLNALLDNDDFRQKLHATIEAKLDQETFDKLQALRLLDIEEVIFSAAVDTAFLVGVRCAGADPAMLLSVARAATSRGGV